MDGPHAHSGGIHETKERHHNNNFRGCGAELTGHKLMTESASPEVRISVVGDGHVGKTQLCHRLQYGPTWETDRMPPSSKRQEFYFCHKSLRVGSAAPDEDDGSMPNSVDQVGATATELSLRRKQDDVANRSMISAGVISAHGDWTDVGSANFSTDVSLKLVEPYGVDRSSLQHIIFRNLKGLIIVMDAVSLWDEFMATDVAPLDEATWMRWMDRQRAGELLIEGWQLYLTETILFWVRTAMLGSHFMEQHPNVNPPVVIVFTKTDRVLAQLAVHKHDAADAKGGYRKGDGVFTPWDRFVKMVCHHCCGPAKHVVAAGPTPSRMSVSSTRKSRRGPPAEIKRSLWALDIDGNAPADPREDCLKCDAVYFVSTERESDCPHRTYQIVNGMVDLVTERRLVTNQGGHTHRGAPSGGDEGKPSRRCCA